jgi:hypothetical protein
MSPLAAAAVLFASLASAGQGGAQPQAVGAAVTGADAADAPTGERAQAAAGASFTGGRSASAVTETGSLSGPPPGAALGPSTGDHPLPQTVPPAPPAAPAEKKISSDLVLGGAAVLGGLQGWFAAGLVGAAAGAGLGLAAAWLFNKKDYGGAFGMTAGAIIGTAVAGPLGAVVGAAVGGLLGHFLGGLLL